MSQQGKLSSPPGLTFPLPTLLPTHQETHWRARGTSPPLPGGNKSSCVCRPKLARINRESPKRNAVPPPSHPLSPGFSLIPRESPRLANGAGKPWVIHTRRDRLICALGLWFYPQARKTLLEKIPPWLSIFPSPALFRHQHCLSHGQGGFLSHSLTKIRQQIPNFQFCPPHKLQYAA